MNSSRGCHQPEVFKIRCPIAITLKVFTIDVVAQTTSHIKLAIKLSHIVSQSNLLLETEYAKLAGRN